MNIAVLEDHKVFAESFKTYLELNEEVKSVELFFTINDFENSNSNYDVTILDLDINGSSSLYLVKKYSDLKFLILSANNNPNLIRKAYEDGAFGYLLKNNGCGKIFNSIKKIVFSNEVIYENSLLHQSLKRQTNNSRKLTSREIEIVELLFHEYSEKFIANHLFISKNTVKSHKRNIFKKLGVSSTSEIKYNYLFDK